MSEKRVYTFGNGQAEGNASMREVLGGKGANLAEMNHIGVPVPPGFTITTDTCNEYYKVGQDKIVELLTAEVNAAVAHTEELMNCKFGDPKNPLLVSVRSGARASMPGMMDTILNLGLNDEVAEGMVEKTGNPHFVYDSYRRFVQMYGDVVLGMKPENKEDIDPFEAIIEKVKEEQGVVLDKDLSVESLKKLVELFKKAIKEQTGSDFPTDPKEQLWGAICAVFRSWMNERAILYRKMEGIPDEWGTAVSVMAMVFGNMGETSATGVCFSRDAGNGENLFNGEYLINAQGEDVVAGIRTPQQITKIGSQRWAERAGISEEERAANYPSMEEAMPELYKELDALQDKLEKHYRDMQDMEFTVENGKLYMLQTRNGKRTAAAALKIACDLVDEGMISEQEAVTMIDPRNLDTMLHPQFDPTALKAATPIATALAASPGAACGKIVFTAEDAKAWASRGEKVCLVRLETSPEDIEGMKAAQGILTVRGGMTSHAAVVARGMGKCCVSGCGDIKMDEDNKQFTLAGKTFHEGDFISLDGSTGKIYDGIIPTADASIAGEFGRIMAWADKYRRLQVRTNADTPYDARKARELGAQGIGLTRTEHMFFDSDRIAAFREMICADTLEERIAALAKLEPMQQADFEGIYEAMEGCPVTIRFLDPPLHEFVPTEEADIEALAKAQGKTVETIKALIASLHEFNPMMGHRGCRLAVTYPEIAAMQTRAVIKAALAVQARHPEWTMVPEIMIPLVGEVKELKYVKSVVVETADAIIKEAGSDMKYLVGTMIEIPRAALTADEIAKECGCPAFIADPVVVDEFQLKARVSGVPGIKRESIFHALNQKAVARRYAKSIGKKYEELNLIVVHLGGGISVGAHRKGLVIDVNNALNGEGPISPERAGTVPSEALATLCFSGKYTLNEVKKMLHGKAGLAAYLGTSDMITIEEKAIEGKEPYKTLVAAMDYTVAKEIGAMFVALKGQCDAIILTGGIAYSDYCVADIKEQIEYLCKVVVLPGENEMESLAENAFGALTGELPVLTYTGVSCAEEIPGMAEA